MMQLADQASLVQLFKETAAAKRREERWLDDQMVLADERERREQRDQEKREALHRLIERATEEQVAAFHAQLDRYDTATVQALMENERQLEEAHKREAELLDKAYQLPDGRKVFKTKDGNRVVDQRGREVEGIDPDSIPAGRTSWEDYASADDGAKKLQQQRDELLTFQQHLDQARDKLDHDGTATDLDALDADLKDAMPDAVKRQLGEEGPGHPAANKPVLGTGASADFKALPDLASLRAPAQPNRS